MSRLRGAATPEPDEDAVPEPEVLVPGVARADLYDDYINSVSKKPYVQFVGRKGTTSSLGHSFIGAGLELEAGLLLLERVFGPGTETF